MNSSRSKYVIPYKYFELEIQAQHVPKKDIIGRSDLYVKVYKNNLHIHKSETIKVKSKKEVVSFRKFFISCLKETDVLTFKTGLIAAQFLICRQAAYCKKPVLHFLMKIRPMTISLIYLSVKSAK